MSDSPTPPVPAGVSDHQVRLVDKALEVIRAETLTAMGDHAAFNSPHEGYAVLLEEVDELWAEVKRNAGTGARARAEATQVAAMAVRYIAELASGVRFR